jgi:hypothetical protein
MNARMRLAYWRYDLAVWLSDHVAVLRYVQDDACECAADNAYGDGYECGLYEACMAHAEAGMLL